MTAVHQKVSSSLLAPDTQPGDSSAEQRRPSSPNPLYRICPAFNVRRPLCEGYLFKQSHQNEVVFNKRYFALYPDVLVYYKSQADCEHDKEKNRLTKRKQMEFHLAGLYLTKPDKKPRGCKFCWILHIPDPKNTRRDVLLVSATREERHKWMTKLQSLNPNLHPHPSTLCPDSPCMAHRSASAPQPSLNVEGELCVVDGNSDEDPDRAEQDSDSTHSSD